MPQRGHFQRLRSLISGLSGRGVPVHVFTHRDFRIQTERAGGTFVDLFARYPPERADTESLPFPCRFVSFAGHYAEEVLRDLEALNPSLVVHDTFAVIGRVVALRLGIPHVNVCAGHNVTPARFTAILRGVPRVRISQSCRNAVVALRARYGMIDASPFSFVSGVSPYLNLYCEPPAFLDEADRPGLEPLAFWGSLLSPEDLPARREGGAFFPNGPGRRCKVYVSFGTVVWRYYPLEALRALTALAASFERMPSVQALISLGGTDVDRSALHALLKPNVSVESYVDQLQVLERADVFITHHGLNSTHEAIFYRVPMISHPFFWDQPALAARCQQLGMTVPLTDSLRGEVSHGLVDAAFERLSRNAQSMRAALSEAREWEEDVMAGRPSVLQQIVDLCR